MADSPTNYAAVSTDAVSYWIAAEMYSLAERRLVLGKYAKSYSLPQRLGKTLRVDRFKRLNLPTSTLSEGTPPDAVSLSVENVDVPVEQWGIVALLTDVAQITTAHPALGIAIDRVSQAMEQTIEREMAKMLLGGTNVGFGTGAANRAALDGTKVLTTADIRKAIAFLRASGAPAYDGDMYVGCLPPQMEQDMMADTSFSNAAAYSQVTRLNIGEIGVWAGVRWVRGNFLPYFKGVAAVDSAATTAEKSQFGGATTGGTYTANATVNMAVVARDPATGYERKISVLASIALGTSNTKFNITMPTSTNYVYDVYSDDAAAGGGTARLVSSGNLANAVVTVSGPPATSQPAVTSAPASGKEVFIAWVFGREAFGRVELNGMSLASYLTPAAASFSNPLAQARKCGAKIMWKSFIIDNTFFYRLEANSTYSANLAA